jgi:hypothetical protein
MTAQRRPPGRTEDRRAVRFEPEILHVEPQPVVPFCPYCGDEIFAGEYRDPLTGRCVHCVGRDGSLLGVVAIAALVVVAALAITFIGWLAAPRAAADPTTEASRDLSGLRDDTSGPPLLGAPRPADRPAVDGRGDTPQPAGAPALEGGIASAMIGGKATYYDSGPGLYGAAGPLLREALGGDPAFRGQRVEVCADECVTVQLVDWCACGDRAGVPTIIDLSRDAFARLAPLSDGVITVTIELGGPTLTLPPTDAIR